MDFQTPPIVAKYMVDMIPEGTTTILEPTPGLGNLLQQLNGKYKVTAPENFFELQPAWFDCIIMNPPFSDKSAFGIPPHLDLKGMKTGYYIMDRCLEMSDHVIALMTWFTVTDSDVRMKKMKEFGLKSITALPRKTFNYSRIQTCILQFHRGYTGQTTLKMFNY